MALDGPYWGLPRVASAHWQPLALLGVLGNHGTLPEKPPAGSCGVRLLGCSRLFCPCHPAPFPGALCRDRGLTAVGTPLLEGHSLLLGGGSCRVVHE